MRQMSLGIVYILTGLLGYRVFEPAISYDGGSAHAFEWMIGNGTGAGIAFIFFCMAESGMLTSPSGCFIPAVRNVKTDLQDYYD